MVILEALLKKFIADTALKMKLSIKDFFCKCDQTAHLLKRSLTEKLICCAV